MDGSSLSKVIDDMGTVRFQGSLLRLLDAQAQADHCALYRLDRRQIRRLGAASSDGSDHAMQQSTRYIGGNIWKRDPLVGAALDGASERGHARLLHVEVRSIADRALRHILDSTAVGERVLICRPSAGQLYAMSVCRSVQRGSFGNAELGALRDCAETVMAIVEKHDAIAAAGSSLRDAALDRPEQIEERLRAGGHGLTPREVQVCARILTGMTVAGIALDLDISENSVATYRQRGYDRLGIATRHELLRRYLKVLS